MRLYSDMSTSNTLNCNTMLEFVRILELVGPFSIAAQLAEDLSSNIPADPAADRIISPGWRGWLDNQSADSTEKRHFIQELSSYMVRILVDICLQFMANAQLYQGGSAELAVARQDEPFAAKVQKNIPCASNM